MGTLLLKTEPGADSFDDLAREGRTAWSGVSNAAALIHLRAARRGDGAFIYHTGDEKRIVGLARVARGPYEDPQRPGRTASGEPGFAVIDLTPVRAAPTPLTLARMKGDARFAGFDLLRHSRLSVMPVPPEVDAAIRALTGL